MTTKTRNDLINQALFNLGILAAGQTADAEDKTAIDNLIDPFLAMLTARDLPQVDDADEIPYEWFLDLAVLLADQAALGFGLPGVPPSPSNPNPVLAAEIRLREITYARPTDVPQRTEYF